MSMLLSAIIDMSSILGSGSGAAHYSAAAEDPQDSDDDYKNASSRASAKRRKPSKQSTNAASKPKTSRAPSKNPRTSTTLQSNNPQAIATGESSKIELEKVNTATSTTDTGGEQNMITGGSSKMAIKKENAAIVMSGLTFPRKQNKAIDSSSKVGTKKGNTITGTRSASMASEEQHREIDPGLYDKVNREFQDEMDKEQPEYDGMLFFSTS